MMKQSERTQTRCCVTGGDPAGMMLGFLLARAGADVVVLEKQPIFRTCQPIVSSLL